jgi:hypothetical protein
MMYAIDVPHGAASSGSPAPGLWYEANLHRAEEVVHLLDEVTAALTFAGFPSRDCTAVWRLLSEAVVEGLRQGKLSEPSMPVRVRYHIAINEITVEIAGEGPDNRVRLCQRLSEQPARAPSLLKP